MTPLQELLLQIVGTWVRAALTLLSGILIAHHAITAPQGEQLGSMLFSQILNALPGLVAQVWSMVQKTKMAQKVQTALAMPMGSTSQDLNAKLATPGGTVKLLTILLACALGLGTMTGCALNPQPPAGTYSAAGTKAFNADQLLKDLSAVGQTARNLNATTGTEHLTDKDTAMVRDASLIAAAGLNAWGTGATTLGAFKASLDAAPLPAGLPTTIRAAVDQAITDHGAGASTLYVVVDVYKTLRANISVDGAKNPKLAAVLGAVDAGIAAIPIQ